MVRTVFQPCCGIVRTLPVETQVGDTFQLVPCPRCNATFYGRLVEADLIEQLDAPPTTNVCESKDPACSLNS